MRLDTVMAAAVAALRTLCFMTPTPTIMVLRYETTLTIARIFQRGSCGVTPQVLVADDGLTRDVAAGHRLRHGIPKPSESGQRTGQVTGRDPRSL